MTDRPFTVVPVTRYAVVCDGRTMLECHDDTTAAEIAEQCNLNALREWANAEAMAVVGQLNAAAEWADDQEDARR